MPKVIVPKLKALRLKNKLSVDEITERIGVARSTYYLYEQGNRNLSKQSQLLLCDLYNLNPDVDLLKPVEIDESLLLTKRGISISS